MSEAIRQMLDKNLEVVLEFLMPVRLISVAIVIVVAFVLWKIIRKYIKKSLDKTEEDEGKKQTIIRLTAAAIRDVIILFVIVIVLADLRSQCDFHGSRSWSDWYCGRSGTAGYYERFYYGI